MKSNARWTVNFNQQTCVKDGNYVVPYLSFENAGDSIEFMSKVCNQFSQIIDAFLVNSTINGDLAKSFTYLWYYTFRFTTKEKELNAASNVDDSIIAAVNHDISTNTVSKQLFDKSEVIFKTAINAWG